MRLKKMNERNRTNEKNFITATFCFGNWERYTTEVGHRAGLLCMYMA